MSRSARTDIGNHIYHVINRANARQKIFKTDKDFEVFEKVLAEAQERTQMRILAYCIMPNHWHLVLLPRNDGDLSKFTGWLTLTHTQRYHAFYNTVGYGHLYQGRYKSFVVQRNDYFLRLCRYVEQNPLRAKLVNKAQDWLWSSLWRRECGTDKQKQLLSIWPVPVPDDYISWVNTKITNEELLLVRESITRGRPYGNENWTKKIVGRFGLESTVRKRGRPKKGS